MSQINLNLSDGIARITLNNPPLNVVTLQMTRELDALLDDLVSNSDARVLVLTGSGERAFCAGADVKEFAHFVEADDRALDEKIRPENAMYNKLARFPKPTIAAVNGHALGGGLELAVCCDLIVASSSARIGLPEVNLGVFPGAGGTLRVPRRIGEGRAKEMMLLGEPIDAQTALAWGLVNRVVVRDEVLPVALDLAHKLAALPNRALQLCKEAVSYAFDLDADGAIEHSMRLINDAFHTQDVREGVRAFFAKEKPNFRHE